MHFKLLLISSMYKGYLDLFYKTHPKVQYQDYRDHYDCLLADSTEFVASYINCFKKLGIIAECVIANDKKLQNNWRRSYATGKCSDHELIFRQIKEFNPDVLWIDDFHRINKELLDKIRSGIKGIKLIIGYHCSPINAEIVKLMRDVDLIITCTPGIRDDLSSHGLNTCLVYHAFDTDLLPRIGNPDKIPGNTFVFTGTLQHGKGAHNKRIELLEKLLKSNIGLSVFLNVEPNYKILAKQIVYLLNRLLSFLRLDDLKSQYPVFEYLSIPVKKYPSIISISSGKPFYGIEMFRLLASSGIVLNVHGDASGNYCGNMRMFEATGAGACLLTENRVNIRDLFEPGKEVVVYNNPEDCIEKAKWLINNEGDRIRIAEAGRKKTLMIHKVEDRCRQILDLLEKEINNKY